MSEFPEERLDLSTEQGFGYFAGYPAALLKQGRYRIIRKLGFGPRSSAWLASDLQSEGESFVALKILTTHATSEQSLELHALQEIRRGNRYELPILRDNFIEKSRHGDHLCCALNLLGTDVDAFRKTSPTKSLRVHTVKKVIASLLEPLCDLSEIGIIHRAVKADNFLFSVAQRAVDIRPILDASPPSVVQQEVTVNGTKYPIVLSEPFSHGHQWDDDLSSVANYGIHLSNLGHAKIVGKDVSWDTGVDPSLRPPEVILATGMDAKADIWMLGCATYHLLTGTPLFSQGLNDIEHLARILAITGDSFKIATAQKSKRLSEFFDADGYFEHPIPDTNLEAALRGAGTIPEKDVQGVVDFIQECLSLHPEDRPSAADLVGHEWVKSGLACSCGYCAS